jgi:hypothetical protein
MQDKFIAYWVHVAKRFANNKYVMGFDPLNEPNTDGHTDVSRFLEAKFEGWNDRNILRPLYARIQKEAYSVANKDTIMYFENSFDIKDDVVQPTGFKTSPGGELNSPNHAVNAHTYCCQHSGDICKTGEPSPESAQICLDFHKDRIGTRHEDAKRLGVPIFLSEFGACLDTDICARELNQVTDVCEEQVIGWSYWQYKTYKDLTTSAFDKSEGFYNNDGTLQNKKVKALSRPYVQLAQG